MMTCFKRYLVKSALAACISMVFAAARAQAVAGTLQGEAGAHWIRPAEKKDPAVWGIRGGIVFGLWPYGIETGREATGGGPRGLIRVGYEFQGQVYMINFIAVEPVVNGQMEFSEISPSRVDGKWGKLMWASDREDPPPYHPSAISRGVITHPDPERPEVEELSVYIFMEQFKNGAHPYLKLAVRSDRPEELSLQIFNHENSAVMDRCALTATMGNYSRLRLLYLKDRAIHSAELYREYDDIHFVEKDSYPASEFPKDGNGDYLVVASTDESFEELASWPQDPAYLARSNWRYRPFFKLTQYWRKESAQADPSLHARVNGRAYYWSGGSGEKSRYVKIPGGASFENFELREAYYPGQKFYFGLTRKEPADLISTDYLKK